MRKINAMKVSSRMVCGAACIAMFAGAAIVACGGDDSVGGGGTSPLDGGGGTIDGANGEGGQSGEGGGGGCSSCPTGYTCGTFNGIQACKSPAGIPLFDHVILVMMENLTYSTLNDAIDSDADNTAILKTMTQTYATGDDYHGAHDNGSAIHPSNPNYIALTSGDPNGVGTSAGQIAPCDCSPLPDAGDCSSFAACTVASGSCGCNQSIPNVADQIETATKTWKAYGEGMGTPCNVEDNAGTGYAVRHVPFLYYDAIRDNSARCTSHVVDFSGFAGDLGSSSAPNFLYIAPNLTDDGHDPNDLVVHDTNITNLSTFLSTFVPTVIGSSTYKNGGLFVIVWDEDNASGVFSNDDPIPIFVLSPYAKTNFVSHVTADHYSLLATIEDGLGLPRLGQAATATPLSDYFQP